jgi:hypothetical protein
MRGNDADQLVVGQFDFLSLNNPIPQQIAITPKIAASRIVNSGAKQAQTKSPLQTNVPRIAEINSSLRMRCRLVWSYASKSTSIGKISGISHASSS